MYSAFSRRHHIQAFSHSHTHTHGAKVHYTVATAALGKVWQRRCSTRSLYIHTWCLYVGRAWKPQSRFDIIQISTQIFFFCVFILHRKKNVHPVFATRKQRNSSNLCLGSGKVCSCIVEWRYMLHTWLPDVCGETTCLIWGGGMVTRLSAMNKNSIFERCICLSQFLIY